MAATDLYFVSQLEHQIIRWNGDIWVIIVRFGVLLGENGRAVKTCGANQDITERKKSEEVLKKANRQLSLLAGITRHDILNKISAINIYLVLAELEYANPSLTEYLRIIITATNEIQSQIEFTRVYQDIGSMEPRWVLLDAVIPRSFFPVYITLTIDVKDYSIFAYPMLKKVFFNLLDNSIRHGRRVTDICVSVHELDGTLNIIWEDNGVGIAEEQKAGIFEYGSGENTGFGLFLLREVLSLTGITIRETGMPCEGARFEIIIPKDGWRASSELIDLHIIF